MKISSLLVIWIFNNVLQKQGVTSKASGIEKIWLLLSDKISQSNSSRQLGIPFPHDRLPQRRSGSAASADRRGPPSCAILCLLKDLNPTRFHPIWFLQSSSVAENPLHHGVAVEDKDCRTLREEFSDSHPTPRPAATSTRTEKGEALSSLFGPTLYLEIHHGSWSGAKMWISKNTVWLFSSCSSQVWIAECATTAHNLTCLHLIRKKINGRNVWLRSLQEKILRFLDDRILRSNNDGLLLIQTNQILKATELLV